MAEASDFRDRSNSLTWLPLEMSELRVVLLGNSWSLRSSVGNLLLKDSAFDTERQSKYTVKLSRSLKKRRISVTNTPDLLQPDLPEDSLTELISEMVETFAPGPDVFLLVLQPEDFTEQQKNTLQSVLQSFSEQAFHRSLVLISIPRVDKPGFMEKHMNDPQIRDMIITCGYRYLWMNYTEDDPSMISFKREELLARISQMMKDKPEDDPYSQRATAEQSPGATEEGIAAVSNYDEELESALQNNDLALAAEKAQKYLDKFNHVRLNIAITGEAGSGKSTLVNALRGIKNKTKGAAPTGVNETTTEPTEYLHPSNPNVKIWDLPGVGTTTSTADKYLKDVEFEKYDFFIIVSNDRFKENDAKLAQEIQKMKKKFYFVRSKIDQDIRNEKEEDPEAKDEDVLKSVRNNCTEELQKLGFKSPRIFLVSGFSLHLYEFKDLCQTLEKELPEHQRDALVLALPNISRDVIEQKKQTLERQIKWFAVSSAAGAAVPVPGFSANVDVGIMVTFTELCVNSLGLTPESLQKLSAVSGVSLEDLKKELKSPLAAVTITQTLILTILTSSAALIAAMAVEEGARFIPIVGIFAAAAISCVTAYAALKYFLNTLTEDAHRIFIKAMEMHTSV